MNVDGGEALPEGGLPLTREQSLQKQREEYIQRIAVSIAGQNQTTGGRIGDALPDLQSDYLRAMQQSSAGLLSTLDQSYYSSLANTRQIIPQTRGSVKRVIYG